MNLKRCSCCGNPIPIKSVICPECGEPQQMSYNEEETITTNQTNYYPQRGGRPNYAPQQPAPQPPSGNGSNKNNIALWCAIGLLTIILLGTIIYFVRKEQNADDYKKYVADSLAQVNDSLAQVSDSIKQINDSIARVNAQIEQQKKEEEARIMKEKTRRQTAYRHFKKLLTDAGDTYSYTDDLGLNCYRIGRKYYLHDINRDGIPEIFIYLDKYYESDISSETLLDCYRYNFSQGKVECIYNRLNKSNPSFQGTTIYTYGNGSYDKLVYSPSSGTYSVSKDLDYDYPSGDTSLKEYDIYNTEPLQMAFN